MEGPTGISVRTELTSEDRPVRSSGLARLASANVGLKEAAMHPETQVRAPLGILVHLHSSAHTDTHVKGGLCIPVAVHSHAHAQTCTRVHELMQM